MLENMMLQNERNTGRIVITERANSKKRIGYTKTELCDEDIVHTKNIYYRIVEQTVDNHNYIIILTPEREQLVSAFDFLNKGMKSDSYNSRRLAANALKLLFSFESIIEKRLHTFNYHDLQMFKFFLRGGTYTGTSYEIKNLTIRKINTINYYLSIYRRYLRYFGLANDYLFAKELYRHSFSKNHTLYASEKYKSSLRSGTKYLEVPKYIRPDEFIKFIKRINEIRECSQRNACIIMLMYQSGLRIGECLGLTLEDIVVVTTESKKKCII